MTTTTLTKDWDSLSDADRARYERKAARMLSPEQQQKAKTPKPAAPQARKKAARRESLPPAGALIVLAKRQRPTRSGDGRLQRSPGEIISHPDEVDLKILGGAAEPLEEWWGGEFGQPERVDGKIYPALRMRPADRSLWVQDAPLRLLRLDEASDGLALAAIKRCWGSETLGRVPEVTSRRLLREAAKARLDNPYAEGGRPLALIFEARQLIVLREDLEAVEAAELRKGDLALLIGACEDEEALQAVLAKRALADNHDDARKRIAELKAAAKAARQESAAEEAAKLAAAGTVPPGQTPDGQAAGTDPPASSEPPAENSAASTAPPKAEEPPKAGAPGKGKK